MKIGVLVTSISNFGKNGFYNSQEIGLAKELDHLFNKVTIYKLIPKEEKLTFEKVVGCNNTTLKLIPSKNFGINGFIDLNQLDDNIDALVYFSDTQLSVPKVYKWCTKNKIKFIPYIGVVTSHSNSILKKKVIDFMFKRNIQIYRESQCIVKTPSVVEELKKYGVKNCKVAPVGLDISLLNEKYAESSIVDLKNKWGFKNNENIILFIGRLVTEKQPFKLLKVFMKIHEKDPTYKLVIVGDGLLLDEICQFISNKGLNSAIKIIKKIPNDQIWELYRISNAFVNLNSQEIFGMAILEAMYYECKVVAIEAPGPSFILENKIDGILCETEQDIIDGVFYCDLNITSKAHRKVLKNFTWEPVAETIDKLVRSC